jgi:hypothetical protein
MTYRRLPSGTPGVHDAGRLRSPSLGALRGAVGPVAADGT